MLVHAAPQCGEPKPAPMTDRPSDPDTEADTAPEPLQAQVRRLYPALSATERRLADVVLAQRDALLGYSATELAALAGVSKASAARFFRRLGFADFQAFRGQLRAEAAVVPLHRLGRTRARPGWQAQLQAHAERDALCLQRLPAALDEATLARAVTLLAQARRVAVVGYRNAHTVAVYARALLHQVRPQVALLNDAAGRESELLADLAAADVVLAIDLRRRTTRLPVLLQALRGSGARLLLLSDAPVSALEPLADVVLRCPTHDGELFDAYVAPISLVNFLASAVAARSSTAVRARLARIEALHQALADLESPHPVPAAARTAAPPVSTARTPRR